MSVLELDPSPTRSPEYDALSPRELEVLTLITRGLSNHDIALTMYVTINTVKTFVRSAYRKIGAERRSQAVVWGYLNGLLEPADATVAS